MEKHHVPGWGTLSANKSYSIKTPKTVEDKRKLFEYISGEKGEDVLSDMLTVNSMTLNSFWKAELEIAKSAGNVDWELPGVGEPTQYTKLGMRRG